MRSNHKLGQLSAGQVLRAEGLLNIDQLQEVLEEHRATGERIVDITLARGLATEYDIAKAMVKHLNLPMVSPAGYDSNDDLKDLLPAAFLHNHKIVPLDLFGGLLVVATYGDLSGEEIGEVEREAGKDVNFVLCLKSELERTLDNDYPMESLGKEVASRLDELFGS